MNQPLDADLSHFKDLQGRSRLSALYRRFPLCPRLSRRLTGRAPDIGCDMGDMMGCRTQTVGVDIDPLTVVAHCRARGLSAGSPASS